MVVHNPNNWHWVDKNCLPWSKEYFEEKIVGTSYEGEGYVFRVVSVNSVTGDCDVTQRKNKVLCIFDMKLSFAVKGTKDEEEFTSTIEIPEFVHDLEEDDYVFNISGDLHKAETRKHFIPILRAKLMKFQNDLISAHEKDVQHQTD